MKAVLFCRVSSKEQETTGYSLPAQEKYLGDFAEKQTLTVDKVFAVSESASGRVQRKIFIEMLEYVRKNDIAAIVVETTDRLTRNFKDVPTIDKWVLEDEKHQIYLAKEGCVLERNSKSHEWFMWRVKVATAEYYVRLLSENVKKGQKEKIAQGGFPTTPPPGYKAVGDKGHKEHVVDEAKKTLAIKMFELYATGDYSVKKLTVTMAEMGLRNRNGNKIVKSRMHMLLQDPFYIGKMRWNGVVTQGKHKPLISVELFNKVQQLLKGKSTPKYRKHNHLFKALIRCIDCTGLITWEPHKGINYGHCNHYRNCKQRKWFTEKEVEKQLINAFNQLQVKSPRLAEWIRKALKESHKDTIEYYTTSLDELNARYKLIEERFEKIYDDKIDGKITEEFYNKKFKQYTDEKDKVTESIQKHANASSQFYQLAINIYDISQQAKAIYLKAKDTDKKRQLLRLVFEKITIDEGKIYFAYSKAFKLLSEAVHATNSTKIKKLVVARIKNFEPKEKTDLIGQMDGYYAYRPTLLATWDDFRQTRWEEEIEFSEQIFNKHNSCCQSKFFCCKCWSKINIFFFDEEKRCFLYYL